MITTVWGRTAHWLSWVEWAAENTLLTAHPLFDMTLAQQVMSRMATTACHQLMISLCLQPPCGVILSLNHGDFMS
jgi:hypothetical protein